ncbi:MAG: hypothetical protein ABW137_16695 [Mycobacterium sp.]
MAPMSRRAILSLLAGTGAAAEISFLAGCADSGDERDVDEIGQGATRDDMTQNPYDFGAIGDGKNDDTAALQGAVDAAVAQGRGAVELTRGRFFIPGHLEIEQPGVSLVSRGGAVVGGGEVRIGPSTYDTNANGIDFSGDSISGVVFDHGDDYGTTRCLVLRNVRGLDVSRNLFRSAGKGIAVEAADGNDKVHTTAMLRVSDNRFAKLVFGIYADTKKWDVLSDWHVTDNYFNYCSDSSVWIACTDGENPGGVDGLNFSGNTVFSMNHNARRAPLFAHKRYNLRVGQSNWLRIINNNFFEAGLSAVYLDTPHNFTFVGNHVAWPGQRELGDALEIHNGRPTGIIEGNTFASWTRAAIGFYDLKDLTRIEVGQNALHWTASPDSWTGTGPLPGYRVFASTGGSGYPVIRDFQVTGAYDDIKGGSHQQSRDIKTPKGGVTGAFRGGLSVSETVTVFRVSDIADTDNFGGLISMTVTGTGDDSLIATYLLFVSSQGSVCSVIASGGLTEGVAAEHPSFTWALAGTDLQATPVGATNGTYDFDAVGLGAAAPS